MGARGGTRRFTGTPPALWAPGRLPRAARDLPGLGLGPGPKCSLREGQNRLCLRPPSVLLMGKTAQGQALHAGLGDTPHGPRGWPLRSRGSEGLRSGKAGRRPGLGVRRKQAVIRSGTGGLSPRGFQARVQMPFAQQVPGKTSFWEGCGRGRRGRGPWPGPEQGPGLLNKHREACSGRSQAPGRSPPKPVWPPRPGPLQGTLLCGRDGHLLPGEEPPPPPGPALGKSFLS